MHRRDLLLALAGAKIPAAVPAGYQLVWQDEFEALSLRSGGPSYDGLTAGSGTWAASGVSYSSDPRGVEGYGFDWFVDPSYRWPGDYSGPFAIEEGGLRIRSQSPFAEIGSLLPRVKGRIPWLSGHLTTLHSVLILPPFYFETRAKMPTAVGRPLPQIWMMTNARRPWPNDKAREHEIDVHEGFADDDRLHCTIDWNPLYGRADYPTRTVVNMAAGVNLASDFNTWGCLVTREQQVFYFNQRRVGHVWTPRTGAIDQPFGIILDSSAGPRWKGPPSDGPHDMIVRYVRLYAADRRGVLLSRPGS